MMKDKDGIQHDKSQEIYRKCVAWAKVRDMSDENINVKHVNPNWFA